MEINIASRLRINHLLEKPRVLEIFMRLVLLGPRPREWEGVSFIILVIPEKRPANAFRIKVRSSDGDVRSDLNQELERSSLLQFEKALNEVT